MAIRASSSQQIDILIADLSSPSAVTREAAVARLTVLGGRALDRLIALAASSAPAAARAAAFRALEGIADPRAMNVALRFISDADAAVATAAIGTARAFMRGRRGAAVVDAVADVALDRRHSDEIRLAALRSLMDLERTTIAPLLESLASDPRAAVRDEAASRTRSGPDAIDPIDALRRAAEQDLPDEPRVLHAAIVAAGNRAGLPTLLAIVERVRAREGREPPGPWREWTTVRAAAHLALAKRGSRIAIYDLREALEGAGSPLPVEFLAALSEVGDASCLEPIAGAYTRAGSTAEHNWWRDHLRDAFRTIVEREKLTGRHAVIKRIAKRTPDLLVRRT